MVYNLNIFIWIVISFLKFYNTYNRI